jgi:hypothetical protein
MAKKRKFGFFLVGRGGRFMKSATEGAKRETEAFSEFLTLRQPSMRFYCKIVILYIFLPCLAISSLLFYGVNNPKMKIGCTTVTNSETGVQVQECTSISWFLIFLFVRHVIVGTFTKVFEIVIIDYIALKTRLLVRLFGAIFTLMVSHAVNIAQTI